MDVGSDYNIDPSLIQKAINKKTKAIMPVHLTGRIANMNEITNIANKNNLILIEDAAQAIGAKYHNKRAGSFGSVASFSLHPLKNLHVNGDGGIVITNNKNIHDFMKKIRNHGLKNRDQLDFWGYNSRLDNINAGIARIKLKKLDIWNKRFRKISKYYSDELSNYFKVPFIGDHEEPIFHRYMIQYNKRDLLMKFLYKKNVETRINYPIPLHLQKPSRIFFNYKKGDFPVAEKQSKEILSLPIYNELTDSQVEYVVKCIKGFFS